MIRSLSPCISVLLSLSIFLKNIWVLRITGDLKLILKEARGELLIIQITRAILIHRREDIKQSLNELNSLTYLLVHIDSKLLHSAVELLKVHRTLVLDVKVLEHFSKELDLMNVPSILLSYFLLELGLKAKFGIMTVATYSFIYFLESAI